MDMDCNRNGNSERESVPAVRELAPSGPMNGRAAAEAVAVKANGLRRVRLTEEQLAKLYVAYRKLGALIADLEQRAHAEAKH